LDQAAQGGGWVPVPGGVQKPCGCGTRGHGLAGMGVLGWWLDLVILEVFPTFMILWVCEWAVFSGLQRSKQRALEFSSSTPGICCVWSGSPM